MRKTLTILLVLFATLSHGQQFRYVGDTTEFGTSLGVGVHPSTTFQAVRPAGRVAYGNLTSTLSFGNNTSAYVPQLNSLIDGSLSISYLDSIYSLPGFYTDV